MSQPDRLRILAVQANPVAGDISGNLARAQAALAEGEAAGADLVVLPEMFLSGYQLLDLSVRPAFLRDCQAAIDILGRGYAPGRDRHRHRRADPWDPQPSPGRTTPAPTMP